MKRFLKNCFWRSLCAFFSITKKLDNQKVYFKAYNGLGYTCNPKAISEKLHEIAPQMKIVWSFKNPTNVKNLPSYITKVKKNSWADYRELFTAKFWVFNAGMVIPHKRKGQIFLDTWHGDRAFKNVSFSADHSTSIVESYKLADVILSGSDYGDKIIRNSMKYSGEILRCGSPRNDLFFHYTKEQVNSIKSNLGISQNAKVLMFAPTFRGVNSGVEPLDFTSLLSDLQKRDNAEWVCLIRQHYKAPRAKSWENSKAIFDVSSYSDMQELLLISDVVISDYSSLVGDFALLKRPIVLYVPDLENYKSGRGLNFELEKSPFIYAENENDLFQKILEFTPQQGKENCEAILNFYGHVVENGNASKAVCDWILKRV